MLASAVFGLVGAVVLLFAFYAASDALATMVWSRGGRWGPAAARRWLVVIRVVGGKSLPGTPSWARLLTIALGIGAIVGGLALLVFGLSAVSTAI
jgi:hypothetical protein